MKCGADLATMRTSVVRALSFSAVFALSLNPVLTPAIAADYRPVAQVAAADGQMNARFLSLGVGKSIVIDLPRDIKDVLVADPKIANAVVRSSQRAYIIGASVGQTNIVFFDSAGQQIAAYDIAVKRDLNGVRAALKQVLPNADIQIDGLGDGVVLTGTAANPLEAQQANDLAARLAGGTDKVVNSIVVRGRDEGIPAKTCCFVDSVPSLAGPTSSASTSGGPASSRTARRATSLPHPFRPNVRGSPRRHCSSASSPISSETGITSPVSSSKVLPDLASRRLAPACPRPIS